MNEPRIFLCYAKEDKPPVQELYNQLKAAGYYPWFDKEDLLPGQDWEREIRKIISDPYNIFVACLSCQSTTKRGVVQKEITWALDVLDQMPEGAIYLIPALLEPCRVPSQLSKRHWVELFEPDGLEKLKQALNFELGKRRPPFEPELVLIPAGEFLMGSDPRKDEHARDNEQPLHHVFLPDYYMAKTPVTNIQYAVFVQAAPYRVPEHWKGGGLPPGKENHPTGWVSWLDAQTYCLWLSEVTGKPYRLPSEAEWEKGARGGLFLDGDTAAHVRNSSPGRIYPWGDEPPDESRCSFGAKEPDTMLVISYPPMPVRGYPQGASPYGLLDMAGNVGEWCHSLYKPYPYNATDGREDPDQECLCVTRGSVLR